MNSLFIETSAKTAVGVREAFTEVVEKIMETPELWAPVTPERKGAVGRGGGGGWEMPGTIDLGKTGDSDGGGEAGGCQC
jgi:Ras-related protein Rab-18